jgi:4-amino-4-deoxy-L-arabinose transferase-like glycosyltransferase
VSISDGTLIRRTAQAAAVALLLFVVLFWRLGQPTFWDPDEAHYAQTSRELLRTGDWLAPSYNEQPFFDKPVLFHWLQGAAMALFGENEFAARLVPALAALGLVGVTVWLGATLVSFDVGLIAALILAANPAVFALARYAILDTVFTLFLFGGASLLAVAALQNRPRLQWGGYLLVALAVLTKGPLAFVLTGLTLLLSCAFSRELRQRLFRLRFILGFVLIVLVAAPWFVYMWLRFHDGFVNGYVLDENISLYARNRFNARADPWFYFRVLAAGVLPWTGLLLGRLYDDVRNRFRGNDPPDHFDVLLWAWIIAIVGFFTFSHFKLDHYVFPAAPAIALLCARAWTDLRARTLDGLTTGSRLGFHTVGPILVVAGAGGGYFMIARLELPPLAIAVPIVMLIAGGVITARASLGNWKAPRVPWIALAALGITYAGILLFVIPKLEERKVVPDVARWVAGHAQPTDRVAIYRLNRWSTAFRFYVDRHTPHLESASEAKAFFSERQPFYCVMLRPAYEEFVAQGVPLTLAYEREGMWATSGRALWRRRIPSTRFVVVRRSEERPAVIQAPPP